MKALALCLFGVFSLAVSTGCGTMSNGRRWGEDTTLLPGWQRIEHAAVTAIKSPFTWIPALGALTFQIENWDSRTADWARFNNPLYGSKERADDVADGFKEAGPIVWYTTLLLTPSGKEPGPWLLAKAKGGGVQWGATQATVAATGYLKAKVGRTRPDGSNRRSFPSGHASDMGVDYSLAYYNVRAMQVPESTKRVAGATFAASALLGSWGRVEAGGHHPGDILAGLALGHFFAVFFNEAFIESDNAPTVMLMPTRDSMNLAVVWSF